MSPNPAPDGDTLPVIPGYQIHGLIAGTGTVEVYHAADLTVGHLVAIKILRTGFVTAYSCDRFLAGARIMGQLQHPGIPPVHALGTSPDGRPFVVMPLIRGHSLAELLRERESPSSDLPRFLQVFEQVCQTIAYAHCHRVVHRDIKPQNVMIGCFGEVQVISWGLATLLDISDAVMVGTPLYIPPEQARAQPADCQSDVFGLGGVLCHILTGEPPFRSEHIGEIIRTAATGDLRDAFARLDACGADSELIDLCTRCLRPAPAGRPVEAGAVASLVAAYRIATQERSRQAELDRAITFQQRERRKLQLTLVVIVALFLVTVVAFLW